MRKITIFETEKIEEAKTLCETLCGIADNVSYLCGDDEVAESIDKIEIGVIKLIETGHTVEIDEIMSAWIAKMCEAEIEKANEMIRTENIWALGSNTSEQSEIHVENMMRLENYKTLLSDIKKLYCE